MGDFYKLWDNLNVQVFFSFPSHIFNQVLQGFICMYPAQMTTFVHYSVFLRLLQAFLWLSENSEFLN